MEEEAKLRLYLIAGTPTASRIPSLRPRALPSRMASIPLSIPRFGIDFTIRFLRLFDVSDFMWIVGNCVGDVYTF